MFRRLSLQFKILIALTALPLIALSFYLALAVNIFQDDKIAYVFDTSLSTARGKSQQVHSEMQGLLGAAQSILLTYSATTNSLSESGQEFFNQDERLVSLFFFRSKLGTTDFEKFASFEKTNKKEGPLPDEALINSLVKEVQASTSLVIRESTERNRIWLAAKTKSSTELAPATVIVGLFDVQSLQDAFSDSDSQFSFLSSTAGTILLASKTSDAELVKWTSLQILENARRSKADDGTAELIDPSQDHLLVSYSKVGFGNLTVISVVEKSFALKAVKLLIRKSQLFLLMLVAITTLISVFASRGLTGALRDLLIATQQVTKGDFNVRVKMKNKDEIGALGDSFNAMATEVARLMVETAEKARMESELATARMVQETLFPPATLNSGRFQVCGRIVPASECGGDWWYHFEVGNQIWIWLGDATGHGVPAALITSAARAIASVVERDPNLKPSRAIDTLNSAIYDVSKGNLMMTFFLGVIDKTTGLMTYVNASHEPARVLPRRDTIAGHRDFEIIADNNNPRLGESPNIKYQEAQHQFQPGERLILFTDGIMDIKNHAMKDLGERNFLKILGQVLHDHPTPEKAVESFIAKLDDYRKGTALVDDVTIIICKFE